MPLIVLILAPVIGLALYYTIKYVVDLLHIKVDSTRAVSVVTTAIIALATPAFLIIAVMELL